jgi:hypothetical protein
MKHCSLLASRTLNLHSDSRDCLPQWIRFNMLYVPRNVNKKIPASDLDYGIEEHKAGQVFCST